MYLILEYPSIMCQVFKATMFFYQHFIYLTLRVELEIGSFFHSLIASEDEKVITSCILVLCTSIL